MMNGKKAVFLTAMVFALCAMPLIAGGGSQGTQARNLDYLNTASEMPIVKDKITLQLVMSRDVDQGAAERIWFWKWAEKEMNISFDVVQLNSTVARERVNLMLASNELPDMFFAGPGFSTRDIFQYGQKEGQLLALNGLITAHAPNVNRYFTQSPSIRAQSTCPDGNIYFLPGVNQQPQTYNCPRPFIKVGWLDKLGLKMPATLDEFYDVLVAFRDRDPNGSGIKNIIPLAGGATAMNQSLTIISAAMGFPEPNALAPVVINNEAKLFAASPIYGEFLRYVNRLYSEQLLDNEYYTNTMVQLQAKAVEQRLGVYVHSAPFTLNADENDWTQFEAFTPMTSRWSGTRVWLDDPEIIPGMFSITSACKYPEAAVRFGDFFFSEKGAMYCYYGPPADHADLMGLHTGWFFDPNGAVTYNRPAEFPADQNYRMGAIASKSPPNFGDNDFQTAIENFTGRKFIFAPTARGWRVSMDKYVKDSQIPRYPVVYFEGDTNDRILELLTSIGDYMTSMDARFITGSEPMANLPGYLDRLKTMGVGELEKIYQDAYAIYMRNLRR